MSRTSWPAVVARAAAIVEGYDTSVTLRQLFYRLVAEQTLPNTNTAYKSLSDRTAAARRDNGFPALIDRGRAIHRYENFTDPADAMRTAVECYRLHPTTGQDWSIYLGVEKAGLVVQLQSWFGELGVPILALGGYASQTYVTDITNDVTRTARPAVLLYGGDFDATGEDIDRDLVVRTGCWDKVIRVALSAAQVEEHRLPPNPGKPTDSRAAGFIARHGELVQVELDALAPEVLRGLYAAALDQFWDVSAYERALAQENADVSVLERLADFAGAGGAS